MRDNKFGTKGREKVKRIRQMEGKRKRDRKKEMLKREKKEGAK